MADKKVPAFNEIGKSAKGEPTLAAARPDLCDVLLSAVSLQSLELCP